MNNNLTLTVKQTYIGKIFLFAKEHSQNFISRSKKVLIDFTTSKLIF